jgi:hypothetical protein
VYRRHSAQRRADDGFGEKSADVVRTGGEDRFFERLCGAFAVLLGRLIRLPVPILVTRFDLWPVVQQRREDLASAQVAGRRQRAQRIAVVGLAAADNDVFLVVSPRKPVLPGNLDGGLVRLRSARQEINACPVITESAGKLFSALMASMTTGCP